MTFHAHRVEHEAAQRGAEDSGGSTTITAVSDGMPPIFSLMPIATGVVTDFGAGEAMVAVRGAEQPGDEHG